MINYLKHWNIIKNPFDNHDNLDNYFCSSVFEEASSRSIFSIDNNNSLLLLGKSGSGKTFFLRKLIHYDLSIDRIIFYISAGNFNTFDLYSYVSHELKIDITSYYKMDMVKAIQNKLCYYEDELQTKPTIVIDDADLLSKKVLNELSLINNFGINSNKHLNLILSGKPALKAKLQTSELDWLRHKMLLNVTLDRLDYNETRDYIDSCFNAADIDGNNIITDDALNVVCKYSDGNYRLINNIMTCCLIVCTLEDTHTITENITLKAKDETLI